MLARELPDILCFYRIFISLAILATMPKGWAFGILYSIALISDLLDGYIYRKVNSHPRHWFNRLPISMDPIADFIYGISGLIIGIRLGSVNIGFVIATVIICIGGNVILQKVSGITWQIIANLLTYGFFAIMIFADAIVWQMSVGSLWHRGFIPTMTVFYIIYFIVRDKSRTIRKEGKI